MIARARVLPLLSALLGAGLLAGCADSLFYRPGDDPVPAAAELAFAAESVRFAAPDGPELHGWWLPPTGASRGTVVFCHGNTGNIARHVGAVTWLPAAGYAVLVFDYRGYGRSAGEVTRRGTIDDAIAALDFALARDPHRTVVFGHSLGGAIAISAAAERPEVRAIAVEGTFPSYREVASTRFWPIGWLLQWLVSDGDDPEDGLEALPPRPLLVVHGDRDGIVPIQMGVALFERAHPPKTIYFAAGCGHRSPVEREGERYQRLLLTFFGEAIAAARPRP